MDGISRSRGWDKEIPHCVLPMEQLVLSDKWARKFYPSSEGFLMTPIQICVECLIPILVGLYMMALSYKGLASINEEKEVLIHI